MQEIITLRPSRPKKEIAAAAKGNINRWINGLIEHALGEKSSSWDEHFKKKRRSVDLDAVIAARRNER